MSFLRRFWDFVNTNGTKVIGAAQGTIAALAGVSGIIPDSHLKYWLAASAVLTFWRGFVNSANLKD